jgi:Glycosyltransferase family 87
VVRQDPNQREPGAGVPIAPVAAVPTPQGDAALVLPRFGFLGRQFTFPRPRPLALRPIYGPISLGLVVAGCCLVVVFASAAPTILVQASRVDFPGWMAGPLHTLFGGLLGPLVGSRHLSWQAVNYGFSAVMVVMLVAYGVVLASARTLSMRTIAVVLVALYGVILLSPALELSDLFNYIGYARLGGLHHLNPYTHILADERYDPVYMFATWRHYASPYGQLFTLLTYPLAGMSLSSAFWVMKTAMILFSGALIVLVWQCARQLGHDPRSAVLFVALNPIVLLYELGGFHNDAVMLVPAMGAISLLLAGRYRWAGAALAVAIAVKFTIVLVLPFLLIAAWPARRHLRVLAGAALAAIPLVAVSVVAFGLSLPNVSDQSTTVTPYSVVNLVGVLLHLGGATSAVEAASKAVLALVVLALAWMAFRRARPDWLTAAGWATLALLACMSWLMPWYVIWALPLAALSLSLRLRRAILAFVVFAALTFMPVTGTILHDFHINTTTSKADVAATERLNRLQN